MGYIRVLEEKKIEERCSNCLYRVPADKYYDGEESTEDRASFCPLRELPEKKERRIGEHGERMFRAGFNACLNEIAGK